MAKFGCVRGRRVPLLQYPPPPPSFSSFLPSFDSPRAGERGERNHLSAEFANSFFLSFQCFQSSIRIACSAFCQLVIPTPWGKKAMEARLSQLTEKRGWRRLLLPFSPFYLSLSSLPHLCPPFPFFPLLQSPFLRSFSFFHPLPPLDSLHIGRGVFFADLLRWREGEEKR